MSRVRKRQVLFAVTMSLYMSTIMSGVITLVNTGFSEGYFLRWLFAFVISWSIALPLSLFGASRILRWTYRVLPDKD